MSRALDILCRAAGPQGAVTIERRRVTVFKAGPVLLDCALYSERDEVGAAIRELAGRVTPQRLR